MILRNYYVWAKNSWAGVSKATASPENLIDVDGTKRAVLWNNSNNNTYASPNYSHSKLGVVAGVGTTSPKEDDYKLEEQLLTLSNVSISSNTVVDKDYKIHIIVTYSAVYTGETDTVISEVGITKDICDLNVSYATVLLTRQILASPIAVSNGDSFAFQTEIVLAPNSEDVLRNYMAWGAAAWAYPSISSPTPLGLYKTDGTACPSLYSNYYSGYEDTGYNNHIHTDIGMIIGTGTKAVDVTDYSLEEQVTDLIGGRTNVISVLDENNDIHITVTSTCMYTGEEDITITEVGITKSLWQARGNSSSYLMSRSLLSAPISVKTGDAITVQKEIVFRAN